MMSTHGALARPVSLSEPSLVLGSGGSRAILGGAGVILACHVAGVSNWRSIGGASGGSIPTAMLAGGVHPVQVVRLTIDTDFAGKLKRHASPLRILLAYFLKDNVYRIVRPYKGLFSSEGLGDFIDTYVPEWPENYWTVAAAGSWQILFNKDGVFAYSPSGTCHVVSCEPAPVGLAVRATCAIPGIFDAVSYKGLILHDGALSVDGRTPVGVVKRHMGFAPETIVAMDVGDDRTDQSALSKAVYNFLWRLVCGRHCPDEGARPHDSDGVLLVKPEGMKIRYLQFHLTRAEKWQTVMCGFRGTIDLLEASGNLTGDRLTRAREILRQFDEFEKTSSTPDELALRTEAMLASHGLY